LIDSKIYVMMSEPSYASFVNGEGTHGDHMKVTSYEASSIEAKRFMKAGEKTQNVRVDQNSSITEINRLTSDTASIGFRFTINYSNRGYMKIEGTVTVQGEIEPLLEEWSKTGSMPVEEANIVHNVIVSNCLPTALLVSRDIKLPPPFPLPRVSIQKKTSKQSESGIEVA
jgi:hypothetical protein